MEKNRNEAENKSLTPLQKRFSDNMPLQEALGNPVRLHMILMMLDPAHSNGMRVNEIAKAASLSRAAASVHLKALKEAGLVSMRKEGTKNFYYFELPSHLIDQQIELWTLLKEYLESLPDRSLWEEE